MRHHRRHCSVEEVQNSVVNPLKADPELVNPVAQKVGLGPPQFMAHFTQPLQSKEALVLNICGQPAEPLQEWSRFVVFLIKDDFRSRHSIPVYSQICEIANGPAARTALRGWGWRFGLIRGSARARVPSITTPEISAEDHH